MEIKESIEDISQYYIHRDLRDRFIKDITDLVEQVEREFKQDIEIITLFAYLKGNAAIECHSLHIESN